MTKLRGAIIVTTCFVVILVLQFCMAGKHLSRTVAEPTELSGTIRLSSMAA
jgi:hypothetical protein